MTRQPYRFLKQKPGYCGPASLAIALESIGIRLSQELLAIWAGFEEAWGTDHKGMLRVSALFFEPEVKIGETLDTLGLIAPIAPVVVNWMSGEDHHEDGHYSLLDRLEPGKVVLMDPSCGENTLDRANFEANWWDLARTGRVDNWAMVLHPKMGNK